MGRTRPPEVSGRFYPSGSDELTEEIDRAAGAASGSSPVTPLAVISPHAAYRWSGPVAASAHRALAGRSTPIERVVIAGPTHRIRANGVVTSSADRFQTPLGPVPVDTAAVHALVAGADVDFADRCHDREYSIEVQLPFVQRLIGDIPIVPLIVGSRTPPWHTADVLERLWRDDSTGLVVSSDLSHHRPIGDAARFDRETSDLVERLDVEAIGPDRMCGSGAVRGLLKVARRRHLEATCLDRRTSADAGADPSAVVGYGAFSFGRPAVGPLDEHDRDALLSVADTAARRAVGGGPAPALDAGELSTRAAGPGAAFVSTSVGGAIRGCIGRIEPTSGLAETVAWAAAEATAGRAWFQPVLPGELDDMTVEVQVLSPLTRMHIDTEDELVRTLEPGEDGLVLSERERQATYLPTVWGAVPDPREFVTGLLAKGGFENPWSTRRAAYRYSTTVIPG